MTVLWTTTELPASAFDPEPAPDDGPWCYRPDLWGHGLTARDLATMTDVPTGEYL